jgi:hypothetical protein
MIVPIVAIPPSIEMGLAPYRDLFPPDRDLPTHQGILHRAGDAGEAEHQSTGGVFGRWPSARLDQQGADAVALVRGGGQSAAVLEAHSFSGAGIIDGVGLEFLHRPALVILFDIGLQGLDQGRLIGRVVGLTQPGG